MGGGRIVMRPYDLRFVYDKPYVGADAHIGPFTWVDEPRCFMRHHPNSAVYGPICTVFVMAGSLGW